MLSYPCSTYHLYTSPTQQCGFCTTCCDIILPTQMLAHTEYMNMHALLLHGSHTCIHCVIGLVQFLSIHTCTHAHTYTCTYTCTHICAHTCNTYALMWQNIITLSGLIMKTSVSRIMFSAHLQVLNQTAQKPLFLFSICVPY